MGINLARRGAISAASPEQSSPGENAIYLPISYPSLAAARSGLNAPVDANYVMWDNSWSDLEEAFVATNDNDILVLPERAEPYIVDSSNGFMAGGVSEVDGPDGLRYPVVSNSRNWFSMSRARRGIIGLGPGAVIESSDSGYTHPEQPYPMYYYNLSGEQMGPLVGAQCSLIETRTMNCFFANFTIKGRDFGGVAYSTIKVGSNNSTFRRIHFDRSWRGFSGIPNGETGAIGIGAATYVIENCLIVPHDTHGPSPIMWNRSTGGSMSNVRIEQHSIGMITFWRSGGINTFTNVITKGHKIGINQEEVLSDYVLNWTGGEISLRDGQNGFHFNTNPSNGSIKVNVVDVDISMNGYTPGRLCAHNYTTGSTQLRSDYSWNGGEIAFLPASYWQ